MSAICGIHRFDGEPVHRREIARMIRGAVLVGPGRATAEVQGEVGLGCLSWAGESECGGLPEGSDHGACLTWDGRLDNREELCSILGENPHHSWGDAQLVLAAYEHLGLAFVEKLLGDFALILWDGRRRRLVCARDAMGVRPFYYHAEEGKVCFASQLPQILAALGGAPRWNEEFFAHFVISGVPHLELTPYEGILCLPAGSCAVVEEGRLRIERYWDPDPAREIRYRRHEEYGEHFRELFTQAVRCQLRSAGPVWSELSGGLDSSAIVAVAKELFRRGEATDQGFSTLSFVFDTAKESDEREFLAPLIGKGSPNAHLIVADRRNVFDGAEAAAHYWDVPHTQICFYPSFASEYEAMRQGRAGVLLSGVNAESVVGSENPYPIHLADLLRRGRLSRLYHELREWHLAWRFPMANLFLDNCLKPLLQPGAQRYTKTEAVPSWISREFAEKHDLRNRVNAGWMPRRYANPASQRQYEHLGQNPSYWYRGFLEKACEIRYPFSYRPLVEFVLAIPWEAKTRPGEFKPLLRDGLEGILPEEIRTRRTKAGPGHWLYLSFTKARDELESLVRNPIQAELGIVDRDELRRAYRLAAQGYAVDSFIFASALALELWLRAARRESSGRDGGGPREGRKTGTLEGPTRTREPMPSEDGRRIAMGQFRRWCASGIFVVASLAFGSGPGLAWQASGEAPESAESAVEDPAEGEVVVMEVGALLGAPEGGDGLVALDVRSREAWDLGHIAGAVHIPLDELPARIEELPSDRHVVTYCSCPAEETSLQAARLLQAAGFERVSVLLGGFERWKDSGGEVQIERSWEEIHAIGEPPKGWAKTPSEDFEYRVDEEIVFEGRRSARIEGVDAGERSFASLVQVLDASAYRGRSVRLEAALRAAEVTNAAVLWVRAEDGSGQPLAFGSTRDAPLKGTVDWQAYKVTLAVPESAVKLAAGVMVLGPGTVWVDGVSLAAEGEGPEAGSLGELLVNPAFEE